LVDAFLRLAPEYPGLRLRVAGFLGDSDRPYYLDQQTKIKEAGLSQRVDWLGEVDRQQKIDFLHSLDLFSVPTVYREPKGLSILEAQAAGIPVVQPAHGSFPEILENTSGGYSFEPESAEALATTLARLLSHPGERETLGQLARAGAERHHSAETMAAQTMDFYEEVLRHNTGSTSPDGDASQDHP
jgi:glycosyltransferase involved in cell wall biosynthesis